MSGNPIETIAVVGAGTMGEGIAQLAARCGCTVHLIDVNDGALQKSMETIRGRFDRSVEKGKLKPNERDETLARIHPARAIAGLESVELAIEAVVEDMDVKRKVFSALEDACPSSAVLATNTSSLSVTNIAAGTSCPSRVVGMHFFNPAPVMPLVEIIAGDASDVACVDLAFDAASSWGKVPVRAKDTPGFIVNRVARGYYLESLRLLGEGVAGVDEMDEIMRHHLGFKMGPFELMDLVGLDVNLAVSTSVWEQTGKPARFEPHDIQRRLVGEGHLGRKSGRGFYSYANERPLPAVNVERSSFELSPLMSDVMLAFCMRAGAVKASSAEHLIIARILGAIINEAGSAFSHGVASSDDIDVAMTKGTNYPKGPLAWADDIGYHTVRGVLKALNQVCGDGRYESDALFSQG